MGDDGNLPRAEEVVEPHQCKLDGVLAAVVVLLGEGFFLPDFGGEGVDDVHRRGQRPEGGGVALAGQREPAGAARVVGAEDDRDLGLGDGGGGLRPDLRVGPPPSVVVDVRRDHAEAAPVLESRAAWPRSRVVEILGECLVQLGGIGGVDSAGVAQRTVGKLAEVVHGLAVGGAEAFVVEQ